MCINRKALFSDGTNNFRIPQEPEPYEVVRLRFRTQKDNADSVCLVVGGINIEMEKCEHDTWFDYYETKYQLYNRRMNYYFKITKKNEILYYTAKGSSNRIESECSFFIKPGFKTPEWAKGAVIYQIFVDRFYNGDKTNDVEDKEYVYIGDYSTKVTDWSKFPAGMGVREFYGGDLQGVMDKLDYIQGLGVEVIYLNPIFVSPSNHKYDIQDYDYVDPHYGKIVVDEGECLTDNVRDNQMASRYICRVTNKENLEASNQFFISLVEEIHRRGMKIILDGVFNHCGSFNKWLDREKIYAPEKGYEKGAYVDKESPYNSYFNFREDQWPDNKSYDGWWGHDTLPKLNFEDSESLFNDIMRIGRKWVSPPFNVDGWRLDVAADLGHSLEYNHHFWKEFRRNVKEANPNAIVLAEHYGDAESWLRGDEWDTVMNYDAFMEPVTWFLTGLEKHSDEFKGNLLGASHEFYESMRYHMTRFNTQSLQVAMNELSNHDHSRFLTRTNSKVGRTDSRGAEAADQGVNKGVMRQAVLLQMTWPGAPTIYYGDEAGVCGWTDPDNRRTYPWGREDKEMIALHKELISIHKSYDALKYGSMISLGGEKNYISYGRFNNKDKLVIAINRGEEDKTITIPVWRMGITDDDTMVLLIMTRRTDYTMETAIFHPVNGSITLSLPQISSAIIKNISRGQKNWE